MVKSVADKKANQVTSGRAKNINCVAACLLGD